MATRFALRPLRRAFSTPSLAVRTPAKPATKPIASRLRPAAAPSPRPASTSTPAPAAPAAAAPAPQLQDAPEIPELSIPDSNGIDWTQSYHGLAAQPFSKEIVDVLMAPIAPEDVEVKPDGIIYLPEIKYRRIMHRAFGPGGWGLVPKGPVVVKEKVVTREYVLIVHGRFISQAQGENGFFSPEQMPAAVEGCKSNALMRCCKDLGVASELWDPNFIRDFKQKYAEEVWVEHVTTGKKKLAWAKKGILPTYPYRKAKGVTVIAPKMAKVVP